MLRVAIKMMRARGFAGAVCLKFAGECGTDFSWLRVAGCDDTAGMARMAQWSEITLEMRPRCRFEVIDVRSRVREMWGDPRAVSVAAYCSYRTTACFPKGPATSTTSCTCERSGRTNSGRPSGATATRILRSSVPACALCGVPQPAERACVLISGLGADSEDALS